MTTMSDKPVEARTEQPVPAPRAAAEARPAPAPAPAVTAPPPDPGMIGLPSFIVGSIALALVDVGFVPVSAQSAAIPIIMTATGFGTLIAVIWAARLGQNTVAAINGVFAGFWFSYAALSLGLTHNWFGILPTGIVRAQEAFLIAWLVVIGLLILGTVRLPVAYTGLLALVEVAFLLSYLGVLQSTVTITPNVVAVSPNEALMKAAGWVIVAFSAVGAYLWMSALNVANGGRPYPLGRALVR